MPSLSQRQRGWADRKPLRPEIDWKHPLASGLSACWVCQGSYRTLDPVTGIFTSAGTVNPSIKLGKYGHGWQNTSVTGAYIDTNKTAGYVQGQTHISGFFLVHPLSLPPDGVENYIFHEPTAGSATQKRLALQIFGTAPASLGARWSLTIHNGTSSQGVSSSQGAFAVTDYTIGFSIDFNTVTSALRMKIFQNGKAVGSVTPSAFGFLPFPSTNPINRPTLLTSALGGNPFDGHIYAAYLWKGRFLSEAEHGLLFVEPFTFLKSYPPLRFFGQAAETTQPPGTITLAGGFNTQVYRQVRKVVAY